MKNVVRQNGARQNGARQNGTRQNDVRQNNIRRNDVVPYIFSVGHIFTSKMIRPHGSKVLLFVSKGIRRC
jgi:hypothetical protein